MEKLLSNIHYFILVWAGFGVYTYYVDYTERLTMIVDMQPDIQARIERMTKRKGDLRKYLKDVKEAKEKIEMVAQSVEKLARQFPSEISDIDNINRIREIAESVKIKDIRINPGEEEKHDFYITKKYLFTGKGTFLQFLIFFEQIAENERLLNVNELSLGKTKEVQRGRFQLINGEVTIQAYRYNPDYKEDRGFEGTADSSSPGANAEDASDGE